MGRWPLLLIIVAVVVAGAITWFGMEPGSVGPPVAPPAPPPAAQPAAAPPPAAAARSAAPSFDIVRVNPEGQAVIAGRAAPGAEVTLRHNDTVIGTVRANPAGEFAFTPDKPLPPGGGELTLSARGATGTGTETSAPVVVLVPAPAAAAAAAPSPAAPPATALAVLTPPNAPPRVLQAPSPDRAAGPLRLDAMDYDEHGKIRFAGTAPPGTTVRVYVDNAPVGDAAAGPDGHWDLTPTDGSIAVGEHRIRVDQVDAGGRVGARVELPFRRASLAATEMPGGRIVVQPGNNLWRIARQTYGQGIRYTVIYQANREPDPQPGPDLSRPGIQAARRVARRRLDAAPLGQQIEVGRQPQQEQGELGHQVSALVGSTSGRSASARMRWSGSEPDRPARRQRARQRPQGGEGGLARQRSRRLRPGRCWAPARAPCCSTSVPPSGALAVRRRLRPHGRARPRGTRETAPACRG